MQTDMISRSAAMNTLSDVFGIPLDYDGECNEMCDEAFAAIEALPAIDAVPVVHAEWQDHNCTNCFAMCVTARSPQGFIYNIETPFCPNCGARMDAKSEEDTDELL